MSRRRRRALALVAPALLVGSGLTVFLFNQAPPALPPSCTATAGSTSYTMDLAQAANAATIASVALQLGLGDHAVTVGLATAMQESKLHNLPYGDRDSLGLFQQRPSQGWGRPAQLLDPHYAARAFFRHLARVKGWQHMAVADAAQAVQHSAAGWAYADWELPARAVAQALTGEVPHGMTCSFPQPTSSSHGLGAALPARVGVSVTPKAGWSTASWLVAEAAQFNIESVSFAGQTWTRASGEWHTKGEVRQVVTYTAQRTTGQDQALVRSSACGGSTRPGARC